MFDELSYFPKVAEKLPPGPWLVISPHPDTALSGLGGTLLLAAGQGIAIDMLFLAGGEADDAFPVPGIRHVEFWHLPSGPQATTEPLIQRLADAIASAGPAVVFFPSLSEPDPDCRAASVASWEALRKTQFAAAPWSYEVASQGPANLLLDITRVAASKRELLAIRTGQADRAMGLNQSRAWSLPATASHAEAFFAWPKEDRPLNAMLLALQTRTLQTDAALDINVRVSVVIRTKNRPKTLRRAIAAVSAQTYQDIELVVVNDGGEDVAALVREHAVGSIQKLVYESLQPGIGRAGAANAGFDLASGEYVLFLDDDDWFAPEHIARLAHALDANPGVLLAFSDTARVDMEGNSLGQFSGPLKPWQLVVGNHFPVHAALFRRVPAKAACRFDTQFQFYEDWDFWLQLQTQGAFLHVPGATATYLINPHGSGVHSLGGQSDFPYLKVRNKWRSLWPDAWLLEVFSFGQRAPQLEEALAAETQKTLALEKALAAARQQVLVLETTLAAVSEAEREKTVELEKMSQQAGRLATVEMALESARQQSIAWELQATNLRGELADVTTSLASVVNSRLWRSTAILRSLTTWLRGLAGERP